MFKGTWTVGRNNQVLYQLPKMAAIRSFTYNHIYHHRGQLSVYLRLLDIPVQDMYGLRRMKNKWLKGKEYSCSTRFRKNTSKVYDYLISKYSAKE